MNVLNVDKLGKIFNGEYIFNDVSFRINTGDKIAVIGKNGVGKTTLLKMIIKDYDIDSGSVTIPNNVIVGYLSQSVIDSEDNTLYDEISNVFSNLISIEKRITKCNEDISNDTSNMKLLNRLDNLNNEFLLLGGYDYLYKIDTVLSKFGFSKDMYERLITTFSGGEKTRVAFAKLLLKEPDLLILDEPTNHLDIEIIEWLEEYLKKYSKALLVVTHDKYFINKVCSKVIELDKSTTEVYNGNYEYYEVERIARYEQMLKNYSKQQKEIAHLESFVERFRYKATKANAAQDRVKKLDKIKRIDKPTVSTSKVNMEFSNNVRTTKDYILEVKDLSIGYEDTALQSNVNFKMRGYDKLAIIGGNGIGKTTLIKVMLKQLSPLCGEVLFFREFKTGFFDQHQDTLNENYTIFDEIQNEYPSMNNVDVRNLCARFLFIGEDVFKKISVLSGGEKVRLVLMKLMLEKPTILFLDEPTNHLDLETKEVIEDVFYNYDGPIIFVSHDRYFINKIATKIIEFKKDGVTEYDMSYSEYKDTISNIKQAIKIKKNKKNIKARVKIVDYEKIIKQKEIEVIDLKESLFLSENYMDKKKATFINNSIHILENDIEELYERMFDNHDEGIV